MFKVKDHLLNQLIFRQEAIFRKLLEADDVSGSLGRFIIYVRSFPKISECLASMNGFYCVLFATQLPKNTHVNSTY